jgi:hypothetical protein
MTPSRSAVLIGVSVALLGTGCHDDERQPHGSHSHHTHTHQHTTPAAPPAQPAAIDKTETRAKVQGAPPNTASPAAPGQPAGAEPSKTNEINKVTGSPSDAATPSDGAPTSTPPEKVPVGGKDATR